LTGTEAKSGKHLHHLKVPKKTQEEIMPETRGLLEIHENTLRHQHYKENRKQS
jgi:hypothetical protein